VLDEEIAIWTPEIMTPARYPVTDLGPKNVPKTRGVNIT